MDDRNPTPTSPRVAAVVFLLAMGIALFWYGIFREGGTVAITSLLILGIGVTFGSLSANTPLAVGVKRLRHPTDRTRRWTTLALIPITAGYLLFANIWIGRSLTPFWHDDQMHAVQARMFAEGHLSMPQHPLADFFETFHVFVKPVYSGIHFLGTTLLNGPGLKLGLPTWFVPILAASIGAALAYRIITELIDGVAGLMAVLLLWSIDYYRFLGPRMTSHGVMLMIGMLIVWTWLHWRKTPTLKWAVLYGLLAGLALITRPLDGAAYLLPTGLAMALTKTGPALRPRLFQASVAVLCILPFAALQLCFDKQVTGRWLYSPYQYYNDTNYPGINYDLRNENRPATEFAKSPTTLLQKQLYYNDWLMGFVRNAQRYPFIVRLIDQRLVWTLRFSNPNIVIYLLIPLGLLGLTTGRRRVFGSIAFLYVAAYVPHYFYLPHYATIIQPEISMFSLLGLRVLADSLPKRTKMIEQAGLLTMVIACLTTMPPFTGVDQDDAGIHMQDAGFANETLPQLVQTPAIVMFQFERGNNYHDEPVYNFVRAWPDDEPIIRAQDLGPRDGELFRYYAERQPDRTVYLFNRTRRRLVKLGNVKDLAAAATEPATRPQE